LSDNEYLLISFTGVNYEHNGIDIGTTGTKAIAFSEDGKILAQAYNEYDLVFPKPKWVEFDVK